MNQEESIVTIVRKYGHSSSAAILDPSTSHFKKEGIEGLIGFRLIGRYAFVYGDPLCKEEDRLPLVEAFYRFAEEKNFQNIIFIASSPEFTSRAYGQGLARGAIEIGKELYIDPHQDPRKLTGTHASLVRRKARHALKEGVEVMEYKKMDPFIEGEMERVKAAWLKGRKGFQIHISRLHLFNDRLGKRWFYAKQKGHVVGLVMLNRLEERKGWHLNHLIFVPNAPHGTPELLVVSVLDALAKEGIHFASFGTVTTGKLGEILGFSRPTKIFASVVFKMANQFLGLNGKIKFWEKFNPESHSSYIAFQKDTFNPKTLWALLQALNVI